jgi:uncharacterized Zn finger protein (UPF0148 family)
LQVCRLVILWISPCGVDLARRLHKTSAYFGSNCKTTQTPLWRRSPSGEIVCNACGLYLKARNQHRPVNLKRNTSTQSLVPVQQSPTPQQSDTNRTSPGNLATSPQVTTYVAADQMSAGTCPGGGRCNGTGGQQGCSGCPAFNNRVSKTAKFALAQAHAASNPQSGDAATEAASAVDGVNSTTGIPACQNCGTTITPLWRRDDAGHIICNACGTFSSYPMFNTTTDLHRTILQAPPPTPPSSHEEARNQTPETRGASSRNRVPDRSIRHRLLALDANARHASIRAVGFSRPVDCC